MTGSLLDGQLGGDGTGTGFDRALGTPVVAGRGPTQNQAPPKANAAATPVITTGLIDALNRYQKELQTKKVIDIPDEYEMVIVGESLKSAQIVPPGQVNKKSVPMGPGAKAPANQQKNPATQSQNNDAKNTAAFAGMSVIQFIDQYTRGSTYIYDQQTYVIDPNTGRNIPQGVPAEVAAWYRIGLQAVPLTDKGIDEKRNDYAYKITYQLSPYKVNDLQSPYFPTSRYQGTHKTYDYWFTGQNSQVLRYEQDLNYLYYLTINSPNPAVRLGQTVNPVEYVKRNFSPRSAQSSMGQEQPVNEPGANAADYLYSPGDQGRVKMTIVGDPAWIQQGEVWSGVAGDNLLFGPFLSDGTINYEGQEVLFEIAFNQPSDYDLTTGLIDPSQIQRPGETRTDRLVYRATEVISTFSRGQFTQELNGVLVLFPIPNDQSRQLEQAAAPDQSEAETRRLQQQNVRAVTPAPTRPAASYSPPASQFELEGFGDQNPPALPTPEPLPPTSGGQTVGPASGQAVVTSQGSASGTGVGQPVSVRVFTTTGRTVEITNRAQAQALFNQGQISGQALRQAEFQLSSLTSAANSPITAAPPQNIPRDP
jgi:hypothetical protein